jgi:hypothetical protein
MKCSFWCSISRWWFFFKFGFRFISILFWSSTLQFISTTMSNIVSELQKCKKKQQSSLLNISIHSSNWKNLQTNIETNKNKEIDFLSNIFIWIFIQCSLFRFHFSTKKLLFFVLQFQTSIHWKLHCNSVLNISNSTK